MHQMCIFSRNCILSYQKKVNVLKILSFGSECVQISGRGQLRVEDATMSLPPRVPMPFYWRIYFPGLRRLFRFLSMTSGVHYPKLFVDGPRTNLLLEEG
jgi:hypothetical protein